MDVLSFCASGWVGKVQGIGVDRYKREIYRFSMCVHYRHGHDESQLWLQVTVREPGLLQLCLERGIYTGEKILIQSNEMTLAAAPHGGKQTAFCNVLASGLVFLTEVRPDAIVNTSGATPRIIQFSELERKTG